MSTYYVETYRPAYPEHGVVVRATRASDWDLDCVSPTMTAVFQVDGVSTKNAAIACVVEHLAGFPTRVSLVAGGKREHNLRKLAAR